MPLMLVISYDMEKKRPIAVVASHERGLGIYDCAVINFMSKR